MALQNRSPAPGALERGVDSERGSEPLTCPRGALPWWSEWDGDCPALHSHPERTRGARLPSPSSFAAQETGVTV